MAKIVSGFASSYSPQLQVPVEAWPEMGEADMQNLFASDRDMPALDEITALVPEAISVALLPEEQALRHARCQVHIETLARLLQASAADVLLVFAEDEGGLLDSLGGSEAIIFHGETVPYAFGSMPPASAWAYGAAPVRLAGAPALARQVGACLHEQGFDYIAEVRGLHGAPSLGHHAGFINTRLLNGHSMPLLPILFNSNRLPGPAKTYRLGEAIRKTAQTLPEETRIAVIAVGGLSHIHIDEDLDGRLLAACAANDGYALTNLPLEEEGHARSHNRPWIAAAGALQGRMTLLDYVPAYRSAAATGCGMAFAIWD